MPLLQNSDGSYGGWEYSIITALAHNLNFRLDIRPPADGERWGRNVNGTFTGRYNVIYDSHGLILSCQSFKRRLSEGT